MRFLLKSKRILISSVLCLCLASVILGACAAGIKASPSPSTSPSPSVSAPETASPSPSVSAPETASPSPTAAGIVYHNTDYGFDFNLPMTWEGYTTVTQEWNGTPLTGGQAQKGPEILIRNPKWTSETPMQDIPIMVFTINQWDALQREEFSVSAAPIGPTELGRNSKYVFALPARYNYAFLPGYEEVEDIMNNKPLRAYDI